MRSSTPLTVVVSAVAVMLSSCALRPLPPPPERAPSQTAPGTDHQGPPDGGAAALGWPVPTCSSLAVRSCALPYPSDEFSVADPGSPTGRSLQVPPEVIPAGVRDQLGPGATLEEAFAGRDGFSALSPVSFEVEQPLDAAAVPDDGGEVVEVIDLATGDRQDIRVEVPVDAFFRGAPSTIVTAWPVTRWEYGHTYVARLARVPGVFGPLAAPAGASWDTPWVTRLRDDLASVDEIDWADVLSATRFTVGSRDDAIGDTEAMAKVVAAEDHPVRHVVSGPGFIVPGASAVVTGEVALSDFRDADGVLRPDRPPRRHWVPFLMVVPEVPASQAGAPVAVYGHGLTISKETMPVVAAANAAKGVATVGIDVPNHGIRSVEGGYLLELSTPGLLGRLLNMPTQGILDNVSLVEAVSEHMGSLDVAPVRLDGTWGDGVADLDTSVVLYQGTSMGGVLGAAEVALAPAVDAAWLEVAGSGTADILVHSLLWLVFGAAVPEGASAGDAAAVIGAATLLLDPSDNTHLLDGLRRSGRPVFLQVGVGDAILDEEASDRMVRLLGLPRVGRAMSSIPASWAGDDLPADGRGFTDVYPLASNDAVQGFMGHLTFFEPRADALLDEWLDNRLGVLVPPRG